MNMDQHTVDFPEEQGAIYGVALSLESLLLNGIPYGILHGDICGGFLEKVAGNLLRDLASLEGQACRAPASGQPKVKELLAVLRARCQELIDLLTGLLAFKTLPLEQVRCTVAQISPLREECVHLIQKLEACFQTPKPFYQSRPADAAAALDGFLRNLDRAFTEEWSTAASPVGV